MPEIPAQLLKSLQGIKGFDEKPFIEIHQSKEQVTSIRLNPLKPTTDNKPPTTDYRPQMSEVISAKTTDHPEDVSKTFNHELQTSNLKQLTSNLPTTNNQPPTEVPWCETGRYLPERPSFTFDPSFHAGAYYVQEASSMFLDHIIKHLYKNNDAPKRILDLCAAPGGKSTLLAAAFPQSFIVSNEVIKQRVTILAENISKWGSDNVMVTHNDPKDFKKLPAFFDLVVVDAPCSGSGLFRKDEDAIEEWSEANVQMCSMRQQRILADVLPALSQDGYLIYSTCSYSQQENEEMCDWIIDALQLQPVTIPFNTDWGIIETLSEKHNAPAYRFYPDKVKGEGFFIACFKQVNETSEKETYHPALKKITRAELSIIEPWLQNPGNYNFIKQNETIIAFPKKFEDDKEAVHHHLHVRKSGVAIGVLKGSDLIPHHELALSFLLKSTFPFLTLTYANALQYLKRKDMALELPPKGWMLARYNGYNLGWIKVLANRINNYYPVDWRILKD